jgi:ABC-type polysaccharide/polyol phosphate export permease
LLIDAYHPHLYGGTGDLSDWEIGRQLAQMTSGLMLAGGLTPANVWQAVRDVRKNHGNAIIGLLLNIAQTMLLVGVFMLIFMFSGMRAAAVRGDALIYLMTGVFLFMAHIKVLAAVSAAEGPTSAMMKHRPMNPIVAIGGAALAELYIQTLSVFVILFLYHVIWTPVVVFKPVAAFSMMLAGWLAALAVLIAFGARRLQP